MSIERCRELLAAWATGAAREDELAELRRLLPEVLNPEPQDIYEALVAAAEELGVLDHEHLGDFLHLAASRIAERGR